MIGADHAHADGIGVMPLGMGAHFVVVAARYHCAIGVDHVVITDGGQIRVELLTPLREAMEAPLLVPLVDHLDRRGLEFFTRHAAKQAFPVWRCGAVNDDEID